MIHVEQIRTLIHNMLMANTSFRQLMQYKLRLHNIDLTYEMLQVMLCLWKQEGMKQQELANQTLKDKASLTYLINNLERRGLVQRLVDAADKRTNRIFLTDKGKALHQQVMPLYMEIYEKAAGELSENGLQECTDYLMAAGNIFKKGIVK